MRADLEHALLVASAEHRAVGLDGEHVPARLGDRAELLADRACASATSTSRLLDGELARVEARQVEQVGGELRQTLDLSAHLVEELAARRAVEVLVRHQLEEAAEREERRAQLVRGVGDELAARAVEICEPEAHPVERASRARRPRPRPGRPTGVFEVSGRDPLRPPSRAGGSAA